VDESTDESTDESFGFASVDEEVELLHADREPMATTAAIKTVRAPSG
jgi:hypothetical protein